MRQELIDKVFTIYDGAPTVFIMTPDGLKEITISSFVVDFDTLRVKYQTSYGENVQKMEKDNKASFYKTAQSYPQPIQDFKPYNIVSLMRSALTHTALQFDGKCFSAWRIENNIPQKYIYEPSQITFYPNKPKNCYTNWVADLEGIPELLFSTEDMCAKWCVIPTQTLSEEKTKTYGELTPLLLAPEQKIAVKELEDVLEKLKKLNLKVFHNGEMNQLFAINQNNLSFISDEDTEYVEYTETYQSVFEPCRIKCGGVIDNIWDGSQFWVKQNTNKE